MAAGRVQGCRDLLDQAVSQLQLRYVTAVAGTEAYRNDELQESQGFVDGGI